jgi:hypothetical protein
MAMTRRKFTVFLTGLIAGAAAGLFRFGRAAPRRFVRAVRLGKYPGRVVPMGDVRRRAKWSG